MIARDSCRYWRCPVLYWCLHANDTEDGTPENAELVHLDNGVDYTTPTSSLDEVVGST
jgi:hypothetical protein